MKINRRAPEGNAFAILGLYQDLLRQIGKTREEIESKIAEATSSDYDHLCEFIEKDTKGSISFTDRRRR